MLTQVIEFETGESVYLSGNNKNVSFQGGQINACEDEIKRLKRTLDISNYMTNRHDD
jgi:hypothetical protein